MTTTVAEEEYNVEFPHDNDVYYDTILGRMVTVHDVDREDGFVSYVHEGSEEDEIQTDSMNTFLAWLAAERFVRAGQRQSTGQIVSKDADIARTFKHAFELDPREHDPVDMARYMLSRKCNETMVRGDE